MNLYSAILLSVLAAAFSTSAIADTDTFDAAPLGASPPHWTCGVTGGGKPKWAIDADVSAPSAPNVLRQSGFGAFPWCVKQGVSMTDGFVEVKFKSLQGKEDEAGGVVWRFKDGDNYYVARANALEDNVSLYHTTKGRRVTIKYVNAPVAPKVWHTLRVEFSHKHIQVFLDGKRYIDLEDDHIIGPGAMGVWTKADSVTAFDNFSFGGK